MNQIKKIPIEWIIETLDAKINPYCEDERSNVVRAVIEDLIILGAIDESVIDLSPIPDPKKVEVDRG